jgi:hypothetical protein
MPISRLVACAALALAGVSAAGCESTPPNVAALSGTYTLRTIDGAPLPVTRQAPAGARVDVTYGGLQIDRARYLQTIHYAYPNGVGNPSDAGEITRSGATVRFHSRDRSAYDGEVRGRDTILVRFHLDGGLSDRAAPAPTLAFVRGPL